MRSAHPEIVDAYVEGPGRDRPRLRDAGRAVEEAGLADHAERRDHGAAEVEEAKRDVERGRPRISSVAVVRGGT